MALLLDWAFAAVRGRCGPCSVATTCWRHWLMRPIMCWTLCVRWQFVSVSAPARSLVAIQQVTRRLECAAVGDTNSQQSPCIACAIDLSEHYTTAQDKTRRPLLSPQAQFNGCFFTGVCSEGQARLRCSCRLREHALAVKSDSKLPQLCTLPLYINY